MPDKKSCSTKCYCNKNLLKSSDSTTSRSSKSQFQFIKLKRDYDVLSTKEKSATSDEGHHINFSRRSSTSTINSLATPSSCSTSCSCSSSNSHQYNQKNYQTTKAIRVNKLEYTDQRTLYEQIRLIGDQHDSKVIPEIRTSQIYLFDPAYLKELQEFRLKNRPECFGS